MTPVSVPSKKNVLTRPRSLLSKNTLPFPEVATEVRKRVVKQVVVEPASVPLPQADENEERALNGNGSEDLIIHDSEEEDCLSPVAPRINFSQFAYAQ
jgi:exonuclease-1